jgi:membrane-associated protease RseP (regulator of RpoE activity)
MQKSTIIISLCFLITGFVVAYFIFGYKTDTAPSSKAINNIVSDNPPGLVNPFSVKGDSLQDDKRFEYLESEIGLIKQKLQQLEQLLQDLADEPGATSLTPPQVMASRNRFTSALSKRLYSLDNLIKGGIDPSLAEDIVRRKNSIELKRLELQDRATREGYLNTQQYFDELEAINRNDFSLREELGDQRYDEYLYDSKQNNRIRISSVMLGSAAEQAGIQSGDVVLSYDNVRMFTWQELKDATSQGQLGEYVSISIYRDGQIFSFTVPRGPLGIELGATRMEP